MTAQSAASSTSSSPKKKASAATPGSRAVSGKSHATRSKSTHTPTHTVTGSKSTRGGSSAAKSHPAVNGHTANTNLAAHSSKPTRGPSRKGGSKKAARGQQKIDPERAEAIQEALIREHYLTGDPAGTWNQQSEDAMRRYQADHGWQSKEVPDSRALISLGLGPSRDHLLNPESAMTTGPVVSQSPPPTSTGQPPLSQGPQPGTAIAAKPSVQADPEPASPKPSDDISPEPQ